ncbi:2-C-methyl-D-erythritol 2,4-cyclodiphosphate synthase [Microbacterium sp. ru370.1]|uniref:bifunctional 2-C-methyl-D-erythritol 4-phosphate cytidylyltransferase/2-C-methyl-D-erythritol 2,4-cyclodiphosphate synthase n=1 Tax=unclassified Microbacterium TaxID=2609290 RepID=UPI000880B019|nr:MULTISPECIES: bifunctional 2-C-methyl-D-erythritol 4-phosphate cytidylyltransferase/2-C-methyl-D-erythritol 2,4-cyclodiphosphate synthase [unclassified Microbacterium]SDO99802.1 2-C-methyl-D-erythritol 2,4-cyclodiphosphate synthase [Microbacterium sp. ru370.1]SIT92389.1 2-C-methyl-D-erythritol 2,4-cyclodiphosphate synthase [Microbacterium sp. RU1D]
MTLTPVPRLAVVVVAAGSGTRLRGGAPKAFVGLDERTILHHALRGVFAAEAAQVVIVVPHGFEGDALTDARDAAGARADLVSVVTGGQTRQESVSAGLAALWADVDIVLVHDAARALTPPAVFDRVVAAIDAGAVAVIPAMPVVDTIKRIDPADGRVIAAVDRSELAAAQTPQGFRRDVLAAALRDAEADHTDDAAAVASVGHPVMTVEGDATAFKITTAPDLDRARALLAGRPSPEVPPAPAPRGPQVGIGTDVHAFGGEGALWLAGLEWPGEIALSGHSDGDAVAHAIVDALLAAAGLGDIGTHFGTDRPEFAGAHADAFLSHTVGLLAAAGWRVGNVSVQVQANRPRFAARRVEAERILSAAVGAPVSVSATTTDGLGFTGRTEGVAAFATALVVPA